MTPVWLDDLAPVTVADRCKTVTKKARGQEVSRFTATGDTHVAPTSSSCAGVERQRVGSSPQDLLLRLRPLLLLVALLVSLGQAELEWTTQRCERHFVGLQSLRRFGLVDQLPLWWGWKVW